MITEKPSNYKQVDVLKKSEEIPDYIKEKIKYHFKTPSEKYINPLTSSQEIGWDKSEHLNWYVKKYPKNSCDVTKYADEYQALKGQSPYSGKSVIAKTK